MRKGEKAYLGRWLRLLTGKVEEKQEREDSRSGRSTLTLGCSCIYCVHDRGEGGERKVGGQRGDSFWLPDKQGIGAKERRE